MSPRHSVTSHPLEPPLAAGHALRRILVATNYTEQSDRAVERAGFLAGQLNARLMLLYVFDRGRSATSIEERLAASAIMSDLARSVRNRYGVRCHTRMVTGAPHQKIIEAAENFDADLIVLGTHRRGIQDAFLSTTAERALRQSHLPILMVNAASARQYRRIVLAVDFTDHTAVAIRSTKKFGLFEAADIFAVHAFEPRLAGPILTAGMTLQQERQHMDARELAARKQLTTFLRAHGLDATTNLVPPAIPSAATAVVECARRVQADLVVLGWENGTTIRRCLLGSVAQAILRVAHLDTLIIPSRDQRATRSFTEDRPKSNAIPDQAAQVQNAIGHDFPPTCSERSAGNPFAEASI